MKSIPNKIRLLAACLAIPAAAVPALAQTWVPTAAGTYNWDDDANWSAAPFPNAIDAAANLSVDLAGNQTLDLNVPITVGSLTINDTGAAPDNTYTIAAGTAGGLTLQSTGVATLTFSTIGNTISAPLTISGSSKIVANGGTQFSTANTFTGSVAVNNALTIQPAYGYSIAINGPLSGSSTITKTDAGTLSLSADNSAYTGQFVLSAGSNNGGLSINSDAALGAIPGSPTVNIRSTNTNTFNITTGVTLNANRTIQTDSGQLYINPTVNGLVTINGKITGAGGLGANTNEQRVTYLTNDANDFTGNIVVAQGGTFRVNTIADAGTASGLGAGSIINFANWTYGGNGGVDYVGTGDSSNKEFQFESRVNGGNTYNLAITNNGTGALNLTSTANLIFGGGVNATSNGRTFILGGSNADSNVFSQVINQLGTGFVNVAKTGNGYWKVASTTNDYLGTTTISGGTLEATKLANGGAASTIGAAANTADKLVIGNTTGVLNSRLRYTGSGDTTDHLFTIGGNNAGGMTGTIESSGSGALVFSNAGNVAWGTVNQARSLVLDGTNTDANSLASVIADNGTGVVSVTKNGAGTWELAGANTYTGATMVNAGTLLIAGNQGSATGTVTVALGAAIGGNGTLGGSLSLASGSDFVFSLTDTLTVNGASVTFGGFGVSNLIGLDNTVAAGTYTLINGTATIDTTNLANLGVANAFDLGAGKSAYFQIGSLDLIVVPEPATWALLATGLTIMTVLRRRRC